MLPQNKEEEDVGVLRSWMGVGGFPAQLEEEAKVLLTEAGSFSCVYLPIDMKLSIMVLTFTCFSFLSGCKLAKVGQPTEGAGLEAGGRSTTIRDRGVGQIGESCGRIRGRRSLWAPEGSHFELPSYPLSTSCKKNLISPPAPPFPNHPLWNPRNPKSPILQIRPQSLPLQLLLEL